MFEWWQTILLAVATSAVTGVLGIVAGYATSRLTSASTRDAERRQRREKRTQPVMDFLQLAHRYIGGKRVDESTQRVYEGLPSDNRPPTLEEYQKNIKSEFPEENLSGMLLTREGYVAIVAAPTREIASAVGDVFVAMSAKPPDHDVIYDSMKAVEELIENYVVDV